jgi:hypothetical protein
MHRNNFPFTFSHLSSNLALKAPIVLIQLFNTARIKAFNWKYLLLSLYKRYFVTFRNIKNFYGEGLLAPRPTPKLEDHPLSAVRYCLFNTFAATLCTRRTSLHPQPEDTPCRGGKRPYPPTHPILHRILLG